MGETVSCNAFCTLLNGLPRPKLQSSPNPRHSQRVETVLRWFFGEDGETGFRITGREAKAVPETPGIYPLRSGSREVSAGRPVSGQWHDCGNIDHRHSDHRRSEGDH